MGCFLPLELPIDYVLLPPIPNPNFVELGSDSGEEGRKRQFFCVDSEIVREEKKENGERGWL